MRYYNKEQPDCAVKTRLVKRDDLNGCKQPVCDKQKNEGIDTNEGTLGMPCGQRSAREEGLKAEMRSGRQRPPMSGIPPTM